MAKKKQPPLKIKGTLTDVLKKAVEGNPKPKPKHVIKQANRKKG